MTQSEKFKLAAQKHKEEQAARDARGNGGGFTRIVYAPLITGSNRVFRFTGLPYSVRETPTDSKRIFLASIIGDDGKKGFYIGPDPEVNKSWLLYKVITKVMAYQWDAEAIGPNGKKGARIYNNAKTHPAIYNMVAKNSNPSNQLEKGWKFDPVVLMNVIDRSDMAWHKENKKLKVLSKKMSTLANGSKWFDRGFPAMLYDLIMEDIVANFGSWEDYDIVIRKTDKTPFYKVYHGVDDARHFDTDAEIMAQIVKGPLSAEEKEWEGWDFDQLFAVTPYMKIQKNLGDSLRRIDKELKTTYEDELAELVEQEEEAKTAAKDANSESKPTGAANARREDAEADADDEEQIEDEQAEEEAAEDANDEPAPSRQSSPAPAARTRQGQSPAPKVDIESILNNPKYQGAHLLTAKERGWITGVNEDGSLAWAPEAGELIVDADNKEQRVPEFVHCNPYSGRVYEQVA